MKGHIGTGDDFRVNEIDRDGTIVSLDNPPVAPSYVGSGDHGIFILEKYQWTTIDVVRAFAQKLGVSRTRFGFAGNKDRDARTTQLISVYGLTSLPHLKDTRTHFLGRGARIEMGDLVGNFFRIRVHTDLTVEDGTARVQETLVENAGIFPNYFGAQRFGSTRQITARIGEFIVRGDCGSAVRTYLTEGGLHERPEIIEARLRLKNENDYAKALTYFPRSLHYERTLLAHLAQHPRDYTNALRKLPRSLSLLFVHAFQSELFNEIIAARVKEKFEKREGDVWSGSDAHGFPDITKQGDDYLFERVIGYELPPVSDIHRAVLEKHRVKAEDFKIARLPELSSKGTFRPAFIRLRRFSLSFPVFSFALPKGSYATVVLRQFFAPSSDVEEHFCSLRNHLDTDG